MTVLVSHGKVVRLRGAVEDEARRVETSRRPARIEGDYRRLRGGVRISAVFGEEPDNTVLSFDRGKISESGSFAFEVRDDLCRRNEPRRDDARVISRTENGREAFFGRDAGGDGEEEEEGRETEPPPPPRADQRDGDRWRRRRRQRVHQFFKSTLSMVFESRGFAYYLSENEVFFCICVEPKFLIFLPSVQR